MLYENSYKLRPEVPGLGKISAQILLAERRRQRTQ